MPQEMEASARKRLVRVETPSALAFGHGTYVAVGGHTAHGQMRSTERTRIALSMFFSFV